MFLEGDVRNSIVLFNGAFEASNHFNSEPRVNFGNESEHNRQRLRDKYYSMHLPN